MSNIVCHKGAWAALIQILHAAEELKMADPALLDEVMVSTHSTGGMPIDAARVADAVAFDLRIMQLQLRRLRREKRRVG